MLVPPVIGPTGGLTSHTATRARAAALPAHATLSIPTDPLPGPITDHSTAGTSGSYPAGTAQLTLQLPYAAAASSAAKVAAAIPGLGAGASVSPDGAGALAAEKGAAAVAAGLGAVLGPASGLVAGLVAGPAAGLIAKLVAGLRAGLTAGPLRLTSCGAAAGMLTGDASRACMYCVSSAVDCVKLATPSCEGDAGTKSGRCKAVIAPERRSSMLMRPHRGSDSSSASSHLPAEIL